MFTTEGLIVGGMAHLAIDSIRMNQLRSENIIVPRGVFKIISTDDAAFYLDDNVYVVRDIMTDYKFDDLRPTDNVLDIGANIGGFSLNVYKKVNHVYAVEPLYVDILNKNIELNNAKNIDVIPCALGYGEMNLIYRGRSNKVIGLPLGDIIRLCGDHIDFLKSDCEGGEWSLTLPEIMNIRRIEAEIHNFDGNRDFRDFEKLLISSGFDYTRRDLSARTILISAKNRYIN